MGSICASKQLNIVALIQSGGGTGPLMPGNQSRADTRAVTVPIPASAWTFER